MISNFQDLNKPQNQIHGVVFKQLVTHGDDRGFFREIIRSTDQFFSTADTTTPFSQWSHSKMVQNTVKAWHFHHKQIDWWYLGLGLIHVVLFDIREESPTHRKKMDFLLGESDLNSSALSAVVKIPPGVIHGCKVLSDRAHLFYITSYTYDSNDEGRYPFDSDIVPHSWGNSEELIIAPNDKRTFIPTYPRNQINC